MQPSIVKLGDFIFQGFEVPQVIPFGGSQSLSVKKLPGGVRKIDAMGRDDEPLQWSGIFTTADSLPRAKFLDAYRVDGNELTLTWGAFSYQVVIHEFKPEFVRDNYIPYRIVCEVVQDNITAAVQAVTNDLDTETAAIWDRINIASSNLVQVEAADIWPPSSPPYKAAVQRAGLITSIKTAVSSVQGMYDAAMQGIVSVVNLEMSVITGIQDAIDTAREDIAGLLAVTDTALGGFAFLFGGAAPSTTVSIGEAAVAVLGTTVMDTLNYSNLLTLDNNLLILKRNLSYINGYPNAKQRTVIGGDLTRIALEEYGDATMWTLIADANGLVDPLIVGQTTLIIPPDPNTAAAIPGGADVDHWMGDDINLGNTNDAGTVLAEVKAQQRILRRLLTSQGSYKWHKGYGAGVLQQIGQSEYNLPFLEGIITAQVQMEQGVLQTPAPTVAFSSDSVGTVMANISYSYEGAGSRQFISFAVSV